MFNMSITEKLTYAVVKIDTTKSDGKKYTATGFFFKFFGKADALITNKHVMKDCTLCSFDLCELGDDGIPIDEKSHTITINDPLDLCVMHPDSDVDLCCINIWPAMEKLQKERKKVFFISLNARLIPNQSRINNFAALEDIVMIGCPKGLYDNYNHKPIIRSGITSTHLKNNYRGKKEFLVDVASLQGSSGSPIFIIDNGYRFEGDAVNISNQCDVYFVGIFCRLHEYKGGMDSEDVDNTPEHYVKLPMHIGIAVKSSEIFVLEDIVKKIYKED